MNILKRLARLFWSPSSDLLACPFCGADAVVIAGAPTHKENGGGIPRRITCSAGFRCACGPTTGWSTHFDTVRDGWNRRDKRNANLP